MAAAARANATKIIKEPWIPWILNELNGELPAIPDLVCITLLALVAQTAYAASGFGLNIIFQWGWFLLSLMRLSSGNMADASALLAVISFPLDLVQAVLLRQYLNPALACGLGLSAAIFEPLGVLILVHNDTPALKVVFGATLFAMFLWRQYSEVHQQPAAPATADAKLDPFDVRKQPFLVLCSGALSGFLGGIFTAPGAGLMLFALLSKVNKDEMRSSIQVFGFFTVPIRFVSLLVLAPDHPGHPVPLVHGFKWLCVAGLAGGLLGLKLGNHLSQFLTPSGWRQTVLLMMIMCSITFLAAPLLSA